MSVSEAAAFPNTFREGARWALSVIDEHIPSLAVDDEEVIYDKANTFDPEFDVAHLALRTCHCGAKIDGFYEYVDHLKEVILTLL